MYEGKTEKCDFAVYRGEAERLVLCVVPINSTSLDSDWMDHVLKKNFVFSPDMCSMRDE